MRNPFRRSGDAGRPGSGPDFAGVDSAAAALELVAEGTLAPLHLVPLAFGGLDVPPNVVYVPPFVVELKARADEETIRPLIEAGEVSDYSAVPSYEGASFVPCAIEVHAHTPGDFRITIGIWGSGLRD